MGVFWLSFCDPDLPEGQRFLGVVIVRAKTFEDAVFISWKRKINPGGQIAFFQVPTDKCYAIKPGEMNRLLSREEAYLIDARAQN